MAPNLHSELGASIAARWMACPGSVRLSRGMPNYDTIHSLTGTAAHALAEMCFDDASFEPHQFIGDEIPIESKSVGSVTVTEEMADAVKLFAEQDFEGEV